MSSPAASSQYLDRLMRRNSFEALWPLFAKADKPAKEMTESFSALQHLRPYLPNKGDFRVVHVGDGGHARTAALFALKTCGQNVSIDPALNLDLVARWKADLGIERINCRKATIEDTIDDLNAESPVPVFVTFVHAHVDVDQVLSRLRWTAAFTLACCVPGKQLSTRQRIVTEGDDPHVLSADRHYQVLVPKAERTEGATG